MGATKIRIELEAESHAGSIKCLDGMPVNLSSNIKPHRIALYRMGGDKLPDRIEVL